METFGLIFGIIFLIVVVPSLILLFNKHSQKNKTPIVKKVPQKDKLEDLKNLCPNLFTYVNIPKRFLDSPSISHELEKSLSKRNFGIITVSFFNRIDDDHVFAKIVTYVDSTAFQSMFSMNRSNTQVAENRLLLFKIEPDDKKIAIYLDDEDYSLEVKNRLTVFLNNL